MADALGCTDPEIEPVTAIALVRYDAGLRLAVSGSRGATPLSTETHLPSQPTLSRLIALLSTPANRTVLHEAITEPAGRRFRACGVVTGSDI